MPSTMPVNSYNRANAGWRRMKRAMTQPEIQETPGPRQWRQHVGGPSVSLPGTALDFQAAILITRCDGLPSSSVGWGQ